MKMTKLAAVAAGLIVAASLAFTSCDGLGKDDFFGTWEANYVIGDETHPKMTSDNSACKEDFSVPSGYVGDTVDITMYFDGTSEKLIKANQKFYQYKVRTPDDPSKSSEAKTFWCGTYGLSENSNYTSGTLTLSYIYGFNTVTKDQANVLGQAWLAKDATALAELAEDLTKAGYADPSTYTSVENYFADIDDYSYDEKTDVQEFKFELGGQDFIKGYTKMSATAKLNCDWDVTYRDFDLVDTSSVLSEILDKLDRDTTSE